MLLSNVKTTWEFFSKLLLPSHNIAIWLLIKFWYSEKTIKIGKGKANSTSQISHIPAFKIYSWHKTKVNRNCRELRNRLKFITILIIDIQRFTKNFLGLCRLNWLEGKEMWDLTGDCVTGNWLPLYSSMLPCSCQSQCWFEAQKISKSVRKR